MDGQFVGTGTNPYASVQTEEVTIYAYRMYKCPDCHGEFDQPAYVDNEWRTVNKAVEKKYTGFCCPFCGLKMEGVR